MRSSFIAGGTRRHIEAGFAVPSLALASQLDLNRYSTVDSVATVNAQNQIDGAAKKSDLVPIAEKDTKQMLQGLLTSLGFTGTIDVQFK